MQTERGFAFLRFCGLLDALMEREALIWETVLILVKKCETFENDDVKTSVMNNIKEGR